MISSFADLSLTLPAEYRKTARLLPQHLLQQKSRRQISAPTPGSRRVLTMSNPAVFHSPAGSYSLFEDRIQRIPTPVNSSYC